MTDQSITNQTKQRKVYLSLHESAKKQKPKECKSSIQWPIGSFVFQPLLRYAIADPIFGYDMKFSFSGSVQIIQLGQVQKIPERIAS